MTDRLDAASFLILPWDTGSFRDARPFHQDDQGMTEAYSLFPPSQRTAVGAVRAALAREIGWTGVGDWSPEVKNVLGDRERLEPAEFSPLTLVRRIVDGEGAAGSWQPMLPFPAAYSVTGVNGGILDRCIAALPHATCAVSKWEPAPVEEHGNGPASDNGNLPSPFPSNSRLQPMDGYVLAATSLRAVTEGGTLFYGDMERLEVSPAQLDEGRPAHHATPFERDLWALRLRSMVLRGRGAFAVRETSVGIEREPATRVVKAGMLYQTSMVRVLPDHGYGITVRSARPLPRIAGPITIAFGGEGRAATLIPMDCDLTDLNWPLEWRTRTGLLALCLVSPAAFDAPLKIGARLWPGGPVLVGAAGGRPTVIGGWVSGRDGGSRGGAAYYPAGTVLFVRGPLPDDAPPVLGREADAAWGFGRYVGWVSDPAKD